MRIETSVRWRMPRAAAVTALALLSTLVGLAQLPGDTAVRSHDEPEPLPNGRTVPFCAAPDAEFRLDVESKASELKLSVEVAPKGEVRIFLQRERAGTDTAEPPLVPLGSTTAAVSIPLGKNSVPRVGPGTYRIRLVSATAAGGFLTASSTLPAAPQTPTLLDQLKAPPSWMLAALSLLILSCVALLLALALRPRTGREEIAEAVMESLAPSLESLPKSLDDTKSALEQAIDNLRQAIGEVSVSPGPPATEPRPQPASTLLPEIRHLLQGDPMLVVARTVRDIARRGDGDLQSQATRGFPAYLQALDRAEALMDKAADESDEECRAEWDALNRAVGALEARHNPRVFLDFIAEADRRGMPEKRMLMNALGIEEIVPQVGAELPPDCNIGSQTGAGNRATVRQVLAKGYRWRETGEVFRKPSVAVQLSSELSRY
jgi:hypothetical protein